jgi:hypothetical protein
MDATGYEQTVELELQATAVEGDAGSQFPSPAIAETPHQLAVHH